MHIQTLRVFCDLVEQGSFSKAGKLNRISQSAVSQMITKLERGLGVCLFDRGGRSGVDLTPEGRVFLAAAENILQIHSEIGAKFREIHESMSGEIRIAADHSIALYGLPKLLEGFSAKHPAVHIHLEHRQTSQIYNAVAEGGADMGLVAYPARRVHLSVEVFGADEMVLISPARHPLLSHPYPSMSDLEGHKFIAFSPDLPTRKAVDRYLREQNTCILPYMEFDNVETVKRAVEAENAVAILPRSAVAGEVAEGVLSLLEWNQPRIVRPLGVVSRRDEVRSIAFKALLECLRAGFVVEGRNTVRLAVETAP